MLEGDSKHWINIGEAHSVTFSNLSPGDYLLRIKAMNADGVWNEAGMTIHITIIPPLWAQWWMQALTAILLACIGAMILFTHARRKESMRDSLQKARLAERRVLASDIHDGPLQDLYGMRFLLDNGTTISSEGIYSVKNLSQKVRTELGRICGELRPLQLKSGFQQTVSGLVAAIQQQCPAIEWNLVAHFDDAVLSLGAKEAIYHILRTVLTNVIKHADARKVDITITQHRRKTQLIVVDDGCGFDATKTVLEGTESDGFGLQMCRDYAASCGGTFRITSEIRKGTTVQFTVNEQKRMRFGAPWFL